MLSIGALVRTKYVDTGVFTNHLPSRIFTGTVIDSHLQEVHLFY